MEIEEPPSEEEYAEAARNLERVNWRVNCILTHCAPTGILKKLDGNYTQDRLTDFLQMIKRIVSIRLLVPGPLPPELRSG